MTSQKEEAASAFYRASALLDPIRLRVWDREGLTVTQLRLLGHLNEQEGRSNAELADLLFVTRPSVSALLERLERGGFIRREVSPDDRRGIRIWLEDRGREAYTNLRAEAMQFAAELMEDLSEDEAAEIAAAFDRLVAAGRARRQRILDARQEPA